jgi:hypothetical protein
MKKKSDKKVSKVKLNASEMKLWKQIQADRLNKGGKK